jgi:hypothetical protein
MPQSFMRAMRCIGFVWQKVGWCFTTTRKTTLRPVFSAEGLRRCCGNFPLHLLNAAHIILTQFPVTILCVLMRFEDEREKRIAERL